ncbi:hypothetical protein D9M72_131690 [compost metagenome]
MLESGSSSNRVARRAGLRVSATTQSGQSCTFFHVRADQPMESLTDTEEQDHGRWLNGTMDGTGTIGVTGNTRAARTVGTG